MNPLREPWTPARWKRFERLYRAEMKKPGKRRLGELLRDAGATVI